MRVALCGLKKVGLNSRSRVDHTKMDLRAGTVHLNGVEMRIIK